MNSKLNLMQVCPNPVALQIASKFHISEGVLSQVCFLDISCD